MKFVYTVVYTDVYTELVPYDAKPIPLIRSACSIKIRISPSSFALVLGSVAMSNCDRRDPSSSKRELQSR